MEGYVGDRVRNALQETFFNRDVGILEGTSQDDGVKWFAIGIDIRGGERWSTSVNVVFAGLLGDGCNGRVEYCYSLGGIDHASENLPVSTFDLHSAVNSHTYHRFKTMDNVEVLPIIDSRAGLNDISSKWRTNLEMSV